MYMKRISTAIALGVSTLFVGAVVAIPAFAASFGIPNVVGVDGSEDVVTPSNVRVVESLPHVLELSWTSGYRTILPNDVSAGDEYLVRVVQKSDGAEVYSGMVYDTSLRLEGLDDNKAYRTTVQSFRNGRYSDAVEVSVRTAPQRVKQLRATSSKKSVLRDVISNKPLHPRSDSSVGQYIATLKWAATDGKVRFYTVNVYSSETDTEALQTVTSLKRAAVVEGLKGNTVYYYTVTAHFNDEYASPESSRKKLKVKKK